MPVDFEAQGCYPSHVFAALAILNQLLANPIQTSPHLYAVNS